MKVKAFLLTAVMAMSISSASAEIEILYHSQNGAYHSYTAIERSKKLFILDDDSNTQFKIKNYKKSGNTETFSIEHVEPGNIKESANITITLDENGHTCKIQYKNATYFGGGTYDVKTTDPGSIENHNRLIRYFNELVGNPIDQGVETDVRSIIPGSGRSGETSNPTDKVKDAAKDAANKVKSLFKKK